MGYTYRCDACRTQSEDAPPFMGELSEQFLKTTPSPLSEMYRPGQTVTLCQRCAEDLLL